MSGQPMLLTDINVLHDWGMNLRSMFPNAIGVLHVGSSLTKPGYRDVDVRIVLGDEDYDELVKILDLLRLNLSLSLWGQKVTGLPIDCQVQQFTAQKDEPGPRNGMHSRRASTEGDPK